MRQKQIVRVVFLRLCIAYATFTVGVCAHALLVPESPAKIDVGVTTTPTQIASLQTNDSFVEPARKSSSLFDPSGDYHPTSKIIVESERFVQFVLEFRRRKQKVVTWGQVSVPSASYKFISVFVTSEQLKFRTQKVKGVYYTFDGRFLAEGNFSEAYSGAAGSIVLEGTLKKFVNGQEVFELSTPFVHYPGC